MSTPQQDDAIRQAMLDLEQRVRHRRRLMGASTGGTAARDEMRNVADSWYVSAHGPITWSTPVIGRGIALGKRVTRLLLRWYINPIVDQQNDFNAAVARAFVHMAAQQDELAGTLDALEKRLSTLEASQHGPAASGGDTA